MVPARGRGDPDLGDTYYRHGLAALARLAAENGLVRGGALGARKAAWKRAFLNTPHGQPVLLEAGEAEGNSKGPWRPKSPLGPCRRARVAAYLRG